jgi:hypothetical protein
MPRKSLTLLLVVAIALHASISFAADTLPATDRLNSCEPRIALAAAKEILNDPKALKEPLEMFSPAAVLFMNDEKEEAVFWFYAAQLRVRYQLAFDRGDRAQLLSIMLMTVGPPINNYAFQNVARFDRIIDRVLLWDKTAPNPWKERAKTQDIEANIEKVYSGIRDFRKKLSAEKDDIEQNAKAAAPQMERMSEQVRTALCRPGQPDPAFANRTIELEKKAVEEFAKGHRDVLQKAGTIKSASVAAYALNRDSGLPNRYTVSINGTPKTIYAEVDVRRSGNDTSFALACVTHLWLGQRNPFKDVCAE